MGEASRNGNKRWNTSPLGITDDFGHEKPEKNGFHCLVTREWLWFSPLFSTKLPYPRVGVKNECYSGVEEIAVIARDPVIAVVGKAKTSPLMTLISLIRPLVRLAW